MKSRVHPAYKTKYHITNWTKYDRALVQRGDIMLWVSSDAIEAWKPRPSRKRRGQRKFSDVAIETALTLRLVFHLPLRQAEGFLRSILGLMDVDLDAPDHTTLSRRSQHLDTTLHVAPAKGAIHLVVDSSGLSIVGEGEWAATKHGGKGKRGWKKLHLGVDGAGVIVVQALTDANVGDAKTGVDLIHAAEEGLSSFTADAAYDTIAVYDAADGRGATVVVPPARTAAVSARGRRSDARDRPFRPVKEVGRREWKKEPGYHRQRTVENAFFRYKSILGDRLRARTSGAQRAEAMIGCNIMNRMLEIGRPASVAIGP